MKTRLFSPRCLNSCVSTVFPNIRSTLGPRLTQTTANITKSKKASNTKTTRRTRNSRRIAQESHPEDTLNGRSVSEELLHMIDTMPFQPVSKGGEFTSLQYSEHSLRVPWPFVSSKLHCKCEDFSSL